MLKITILLSIFGLAVGYYFPIVQTTNGEILGTPMNTYDGNTFYAFQGIPFAEPPVGDLRFQPPQPPRNWAGVLDSRNAKKLCIQVGSTTAPDESEDCLYLNVYTPQLPNGQHNVSLPVMVYIYGGAFVRGSNSIDRYRPQKIMDYDIVMVALQYRVGFLGFLSTGDLECPGNNGFKDQQFALRWVQSNIQNFGGDPRRVTVTGQSAGGACVGYQLLGSNAEGLFRGVIQSSGSSLGTWSLQRDPRSYAYQMASFIDPSIDERNTTKELMSFFKTLDVGQIKAATSVLFGEDQFVTFFNTLRGFVFSGVIEPEHDGAFLTQTAYEKFESGNFNVVPTLIGINSEETLIFVSGSEVPKVLAEFDASPELIVTPSMHITDQDIKRKVGNYIRNLYVGDGLMQDNLGPSIKYFSDEGFAKPSIKQAQLEANYTDVYYYEFAYAGELAHRGRPRQYIPGADSVGHAEDLAYIFPQDREVVEKYPELDIITMDRLVLIWTNFIKYLNPTPVPSPTLQNITWPTVSSSSRFSYLSINETIEVKYDLKKEMVEEYARLYDLYAIPPLDTY